MKRIYNSLASHITLFILFIPIIVVFYAKFGNPSEVFFETVEAIAHSIFSVFLILGATAISMAFYVSPEESKRRRECKCCCKCCCKGEK